MAETNEKKTLELLRLAEAKLKEVDTSKDPGTKTAYALRGIGYILLAKEISKLSSPYEEEEADLLGGGGGHV